jgi:predicted RNA binding protein YcfA (HicA-like mRNA interferase family)
VYNYTHYLRKALLSSKQIIKVLKKLGWYEDRQVGSHKQFRHREIRGGVTVPHPKKDLPIQTFRSILKQMKISDKEFKQWLK